jgi:hypothetical protein
VHGGSRSAKFGPSEISHSFHEMFIKLSGASDLTPQGKAPSGTRLYLRPRFGVPSSVEHRAEQQRDPEPRMLPGAIRIGGHVANVEPVTPNRRLQHGRNGRAWPGGASPSTRVRFHYAPVCHSPELFRFLVSWADTNRRMLRGDCCFDAWYERSSW